jgi:monovalent cation:H+ antiporter-2, CPA2 family
MHESALILTLTGSLVAALALGFVTQRIGLSPIVGYLLAGLIVGPHTPGFVADRDLAMQFADVGIILLMFGVGLHFHVKDLLAVRNIAIVGALGQSAVATLLGMLAARTFGWSWGASIAFGLALSVASTVMLTRVLVDNEDLQTPTGRIAIGWLLVEDILTVVVLVLLPSVFSESSTDVGSVGAAVALTIGKLLLLGLSTFFIGGRLIPRLLNGVARTRSRELFTLAVLALALGIAVGSTQIFGVSLAIGAFLGGMIVGQSEFSFRAASEALPMRDAFAVLFFVSVGMLFDPGTLLNTPGLLLATLGIVIVAKPIAAFLIATLFGHSSKVAIPVGIALGQIGEFSLILATTGAQLGIVSETATNLVVAASMLSLTVNPLLYRSAGWIESVLARFPGIWRLFNPQPLKLGSAEESPTPSRYHAVVVGFGPIGETVSRLLRDGGIDPVVVDSNLATIHRAQSSGHRAVYGDATGAHVLEAADIRTAVAIVVSGPTSAQSAEIIRMARQLNPSVRVLARSYYLKEREIMRNAGADEVFSGEGEVALAMTDHILRMLGATPEQMDRERVRVRNEIFG